MAVHHGPQVRIAGKQDVKDRVAVVSLDFKNINNAVAAFEPEQRCGIMIRVGLHCAPVAHKSLHPSRLSTRKKGGKIFGTFCVYVPDEIVFAELEDTFDVNLSSVEMLNN